MVLPIRDASSGTVVTALCRAFQGLPATMARTLTWDRGPEMTRHREFTMHTRIPVFFCDAYSPWHRGSNENTNGLLRQYFPKKTDLSLHTYWFRMCRGAGSSTGDSPSSSSGGSENTCRLAVR